MQNLIPSIRPIGLGFSIFKVPSTVNTSPTQGHGHTVQLLQIRNLDAMIEIPEFHKGSVSQGYIRLLEDTRDLKSAKGCVPVTQEH